MVKKGGNRFSSAMIEGLLKVFRTVRHLKLIQIYYRLRHVVMSKFMTRKPLQSQLIFKNEERLIKFKGKAVGFCSAYILGGRFTALNQEVAFEHGIDWNYGGYGKLWTYNLNYFEFLSQEDLSKEVKLSLIDNFISHDLELIDGHEPYPTSLRAINWIRFFSATPGANTAQRNKMLFDHVSHLRNQLEFHILGNHLLENAFALLMASYYFEKEDWYKKARKLLENQLEEQVQADGGHFEQSPMYHSIILYRTLEALDLVSSNSWKEDRGFEDFLKERAAVMCAWLRNVKLGDGTIPMVNDSAPGITYKPEVLLSYSNELRVPILDLPLSASGYRHWFNDRFEVFIDAGHVAVDYQPGHAHADTFSFLLYHKNHPIIIDTGTSTYEKNQVRQSERGTLAHNTVSYNKLDSSEVWGGFRVGRRARVKILEEDNSLLKASHNGYSYLGITHIRHFKLSKRGLLVHDIIKGRNKEASYSSLHFHPDCSVILQDNVLTINNEVKIKMVGFDSLSLDFYEYGEGFNKRRRAQKWVGQFTSKSSIEVTTV